MIKKKLLMNNDTKSLKEFNPYAVFECPNEEVYNHLQELIEKDTPKLSEIGTNTDGKVTLNCPNCDEELTENEKTKELPNYCPECGQCIK